MNTLIIYDSTFGNTEQLVRVLADRLADYGAVRLYRLHEAGAFEPGDADVLIVGGPTQRHSASPTMRDFLAGLPRHSLSGLAAAAFDTRYHMAGWKTGSAAQRIASRLGRAGAALAVSPESFFVAGREGPLEEGELARAAQWVEQIYTAFEASASAKQAQARVS